MDKNEATKEARIAALYKGGEWYVTRKGKRYHCVAHDNYRNSKADGRVIEVFTQEKVRRTVPPNSEPHGYKLHFFAADRFEGCGHKHKTPSAALACLRKLTRAGERGFHVYRASYDARGTFRTCRQMTDAMERAAL